MQQLLKAVKLHRWLLSISSVLIGAIAFFIQDWKGFVDTSISWSNKRDSEFDSRISKVETTQIHILTRLTELIQAQETQRIDQLEFYRSWYKKFGNEDDRLQIEAALDKLKKGK